MNIVVPVDGFGCCSDGFITITRAYEEGTPALRDDLKPAKRICIVNRELGRLADVVVSPSLLRGLAKAILRDVPADPEHPDKEL